MTRQRYHELREKLDGGHLSRDEQQELLLEVNEYTMGVYFCDKCAWIGDTTTEGKHDCTQQATLVPWEQLFTHLEERFKPYTLYEQIKMRLPGGNLAFAMVHVPMQSTPLELPPGAAKHFTMMVPVYQYTWFLQGPDGRPVGFVKAYTPELMDKIHTNLVPQAAEEYVQEAQAKMPPAIIAAAQLGGGGRNA
jgi:hypothetical protein